MDERIDRGVLRVEKRVLQVAKQVLQVDKQVLGVEKRVIRVLRVVREWYQWPAKFCMYYKWQDGFCHNDYPELMSSLV